MRSTSDIDRQSGRTRPQYPLRRIHTVTADEEYRDAPGARWHPGGTWVGERARWVEVRPRERTEPVPWYQARGRKVRRGDQVDEITAVSLDARGVRLSFASGPLLMGNVTYIEVLVEDGA